LPHVTAYLALGLWLFGDDAYEEVATKVTGGLDRFGCWDAAWSVPSPSGITQARKRLGSQVMREVFEAVAQPVATEATRWAWLQRWRLTAVDGFDVDLEDSDGNAATTASTRSTPRSMGSNCASRRWAIAMRFALLPPSSLLPPERLARSERHEAPATASDR
jgi:hypothetical protein